MNSLEIMKKELDRKNRKIEKLLRMYEVSNNNRALASSIIQLQYESEQLSETIKEAGDLRRLHKEGGESN